MAGTVFSEPNTISTYPIELKFDLDVALSLPMAEYSDSTLWENNVTAAISNSNSLIAGGHDHVCAVCLEGMQSGDDHVGRQVPCGHLYHAKCIASWLVVCNSCPLCRSAISIKQL